MGNDKEDSGFGFKDRAKAEETLRLLQQHEPNYRRLTVRGLLGRAKRVLSMTKAQEKINNIKEAMEVFENWLAELEQSKDKKTEDKPHKEKKETKDKNGDEEKESGSDVEMEEQAQKKALPADTVPDLGFKDEETAEGTLRALAGRDPDYQRLAVKGLVGRAKRVLTCTRDETKLSNIKAALTVFDRFLDDFETLHLARQNNPYLPLGVVRACLARAHAQPTEQQKAFIEAYSGVNGEYKRLRTVRPAPPAEGADGAEGAEGAEGGDTWDIVRNSALKVLKEKHTEAKLFTDKDEPTAEHLEMLLWAYSPEPAKVKKVIPEEKSAGDRKRRSSAADDADDAPAKRRKEDSP